MITRFPESSTAFDIVAAVLSSLWITSRSLNVSTSNTSSSEGSTVIVPAEEGDTLLLRTPIEMSDIDLTNDLFASNISFDSDELITLGVISISPLVVPSLTY